MSKITILECTLRDGSYAIDYQFTTEDTAILAAGLEQAGFEFIEVGHGLGLNASNCGKGVAAATDEEYLKAASRVLKKAKFGMFFIPGIGREEDLKMAASYGMGFVRIGTNITEVDESARYVEIAKDLGMRVSANLMKSYAMPPSEFLKQAKKSEKFGADILVVVDSAGGMLPQDVVDYVSVLRNNTDLPIGYHGHNNLGLAISNTLEAIRAGVTVVDATLRGMGRSAGNAQTEILVLVLEKLGYSTGIDVYKTMDVAEGLLKPLMRREQQGIDSIGVISGYAQFHSSFLTTIYKVAQQHDIDPRELIVKVSEIDRVHVSEELADGIAQELEKEGREALTTKYIWPTDFDLHKTMRLEDASVGEIALGLAKEIFSLSKKSGKFSVFTIAGSPDPNKKRASFPFIRQNALCVIGNAEVVHLNEAIEVTRAIDGLVDIILVDAEQKRGKLGELTGEIRKVAEKSVVLTYKDTDSLVSAADSFICQLIPELDGKRISILGDSRVACKLALKLAERGPKVTLWGKDAKRLRKLAQGLSLVLPHESSDHIHVSTDLVEASKEANLLVGIIPRLPLISVEMLKVMSDKAVVIDAGIGTIYPEAIEYGITRGFQLYRLDMRAGLSGEITNVLETMELTSKVIGTEDSDGVRIVAGGVLGRKGDIVVDSISQPTRVVGVADGCGGLLEEAEEEKYQQKVIQAKAKMLSRKLDSGTSPD
jgi:4-hydroxy 2-oxovalerate aldolase/long-chain acyl-CoA synthetase